MTDDDRGQLSLPVIEVAIGLILVFAVVATFALGIPDPGTRDAQLNAYAADTTAVLSGDPPRHGGQTRLTEVTRSETSFERERAALDRRVDRILPDNLMFKIETPHGVVGYPRPQGVPVGHATVTTVNGDVTIWVWYA